MTKEQKLIADARQFVERSFAQADGPSPSKRAMEMAAQKVASAIRPVVQNAQIEALKRRTR